LILFGQGRQAKAKPPVATQGATQTLVSNAMQAVSEHLFRRGKRGSLYLRRRIPNDVRDAYPSHHPKSS
jgi:hypothetical protein